MSRAFEEIDHQPTPMGDISLRRRLEPTLLVDVYEVKLGDEFLMSSLFTATEEALARLGLAAVGRPMISTWSSGASASGTRLAPCSRTPGSPVCRSIDALPR